MHTDHIGFDDADLVREVVTGSHDALAALYDRHAEAVFAVARRLTRDRQMAEEVVQETFLALWNRAELFDPQAGSLSAWLHTIARNRTFDRLRAAGRRPTLISPGSADGGASDEAALDRAGASAPSVGGAGPPQDPESAAVARWTRGRIGQALTELSEEERRVIVMAYDEELSQSEIADRLGWPIGTVKTRTRRALRRLRAALEGDFGPEHRQRVTAAPRGGDDGPR